MRITAGTDAGLRHEQNQDCYKAGRLSDDSYWMILCDGMGGVSSGGESSFITVNYLEQVVKEKLEKLTGGEEIRRFMMESVKRCNSLVFAIAENMGQEYSMGTTIVMAVVRDNAAYIVHAGDSRAYHITNEGILRLTTDHSMVQELLSAGKITELQAKNHPNRNIITSALGVESELKLDFNKVNLSNGDFLLLCSDGLSNMIEDAQIREIVLGSPFYRAADNLIDGALAMGGFDNVTVLLLKAD